MRECSRCDNQARPGGWLCHACHAASMREYRARLRKKRGKRIRGYRPPVSQETAPFLSSPRTPEQEALFELLFPPATPGGWKRQCSRCGSPARPGGWYCQSCHATWMRGYRARKAKRGKRIRRTSPLWWRQPQPRGLETSAGELDFNPDRIFADLSLRDTKNAQY